MAERPGAANTAYSSDAERISGLGETSVGQVPRKLKPGGWRCWLI